MGDPGSNEFGFRSRAAALLSQRRFSDVEIQVIDGNNRKSYPAHKLFLALSSRYFASLFYENDKPPNFVKIFDFNPQTVYLMLQFLYTDKVELTDAKEARELYTLSKKFGIRKLQETCVNLISKNEINKDNVIYMYECACRERYLELLANCREIVSSNTKDVFETPSFVESSVAVLEDILQLENLSVDSELDIIYAVIRWSQYECRRRNVAVDSVNLRECVLPFLIHIRFLNLTFQQFCEFVGKYPILNAHESSLITRKLLDPKNNVSLPSFISLIDKPRNYSSTVSDIVDDSCMKSSNCAVLGTVPQITKQLQSNIPSLPIQGTNKQNQTLVSKEAPQIKLPVHQKYDFPLQETKKQLSTAFINDVKCSIAVKLLKGTILIHGIELKISQKSNAEEIKVFLNTSATNYAASDTFNQELKNNIISLSFDQAIKMDKNSNAVIEVIVEDLKLNRCSVVKNPCCILKHDSFVAANISLTSNQVNGIGDYFFLISCLIYSVV